MRILVVGAGAIGGYFGGRLKDAGRDVTFLVRPRRAAQLAKTGLIIRSQLRRRQPAFAAHRHGRSAARAVRSDPAELQSLRPRSRRRRRSRRRSGAKTAILPLLNGMAHMDFSDGRFGGGAMLGGQCQISTTLDAEGRILHLNDFHLLSFGELTAR